MRRAFWPQLCKLRIFNETHFGADTIVDRGISSKVSALLEDDVNFTKNLNRGAQIHAQSNQSLPKNSTIFFFQLCFTLIIWNIAAIRKLRYRACSKSSFWITKFRFWAWIVAPLGSFNTNSQTFGDIDINPFVGWGHPCVGDHFGENSWWNYLYQENSFRNFWKPLKWMGRFVFFIDRNWKIR